MIYKKIRIGFNKLVRLNISYHSSLEAVQVKYTLALHAVNMHVTHTIGTEILCILKKARHTCNIPWVLKAVTHWMSRDISSATASTIILITRGTNAGEMENT